MPNSQEGNTFWKCVTFMAVMPGGKCLSIQQKTFNLIPEIMLVISLSIINFYVSLKGFRTFL